MIFVSVLLKYRVLSEELIAATNYEEKSQIYSQMEISSVQMNVRAVS